MPRHYVTEFERRSDGGGEAGVVMGLYWAVYRARRNSKNSEILTLLDLQIGHILSPKFVEKQYAKYLYFTIDLG